jgi:hypothetical protein
MPYEIFLECNDNQIVNDYYYCIKHKKLVKRKYCKICRKFSKVIKIEKRLWFR